LARKIPLPRLTRRQRSARWQRERRQQAVIVTVFSAVLFFVLGLVSWGASSKYYTDNLKAAMTFDGRSVAMRDWTKEKAYELSRFYVEYGVPAGYENDPQIAGQKASFDRSALKPLEEYAIVVKQAKAEAIVMAHAAIGQTSDPIKTDYGYHFIQVEERRGPAQNDIVKRWLASKFTEADIKWHSQHDQLRDLFTKRQQATVVSPVAQVHVAQIQVATPRPVGGDFQSFTDQLKKVADVGKALDAGTDFAEIAKQYSEDSATKDNGGDMGWIAHGVITDLSAEKELFTLDAGKVSQQHNGLTTTTWYKVIEKSDSRDLDDTQKKTISDNAYQYWLNQQKKAYDIVRLIPGLEFE